MYNFAEKVTFFIKMLRGLYPAAYYFGIKFLPHMCNFSLSKTLTRVFQCPQFDQCLSVVGELDAIFIKVCHSLY